MKLLDKIKVLELIGKHVDINAFRDRVQVDVNVSLADKLASARKRAQQGALSNVRSFTEITRRTTH